MRRARKEDVMRGSLRAAGVLIVLCAAVGLAAANDYRLEAEMHLRGGFRFLAERAWADKAWCESWVMGITGHTERYPPKK